MAGKKVKKVVATECRECGATSTEAFLERIKGTDEYICDDCANELGITANTSEKSDAFFDADEDGGALLEGPKDDDVSEEDDDFYGTGSKRGRGGKSSRYDDYDGYGGGSDDDYY